MTERRPPSPGSSKPAPTDGTDQLVPRPTRDNSAGRYSMTSDVPPANLRKSSPPTAPTRPGFSAVDPPSTPPPPPMHPRAAGKPVVPSLPNIPTAPQLPRIGSTPVDDSGDHETATAEAKSAPTQVAAKQDDAQSSTPPASTPPSDAPSEPPAQGEPVFDPSIDVDWQKLWLSTQRRTWRSLVIVPAGKEVDVVEVARSLASVGSVHLSHEVFVVDATGVTLGDLRPRLADVKKRLERGETVIVAVRPVGENPTTRSFAETADAALLCVTLGKSNLADAERAVEEIGRERFLGTAVLAPKSAR